jgi:hypothetical protein
MIESTLLGGLLGGIFRFLPEFLKFWDRKDERKHELSMQDKALDFQKLTGSQRVEEIGAQGQAAWNTGTLDALREAIASQKVEFKPTGYKWADMLMALVVFLNSSVRPVITYWFFGLYLVAKVAIFYSAIIGGTAWHEAVKMAWTEADQALWAGVLNFWFLGRVFDKVK